MKKAKIFLAEDFLIIRNLLKSFLCENNHQVVVAASSFSEAKGKIEYAAREGVNIGIIDGNLGTGADDGMRLSRLLREKIPGIKIIPFSYYNVDWGDVDTTKGLGLDQILKIIEGCLAESPVR